MGCFAGNERPGFFEQAVQLTSVCLFSLGPWAYDYNGAAICVPFVVPDVRMISYTTVSSALSRAAAASLVLQATQRSFSKKIIFLLFSVCMLYVGTDEVSWLV